MFYVLAGELTMDVGGEAFQLRVQGGLEIAPGPPHQAINRSDDDVHVLVRSMPTARGQLRGANDAGRRESTAEAVVWAIGLLPDVHHSDRRLPPAAVVFNDKAHLTADADLIDDAGHIQKAAHRLSVHGHNHVLHRGAGGAAEARAGGGAAIADAHHDKAFDAKAGGVLLIEDLDADAGDGDAACGHDLGHDAVHGIDWDREADAR
jgi:hypothetical protein